MTPEADKNYQLEHTEAVVQAALGKTQRILLAMLAVLCLIQIGLVVWNMSLCAKVYGLSLDGRIFETHSFTCPDPNVEPIYDGQPRIS